MPDHFAIYISNTESKRQLLNNLLSGKLRPEFASLKSGVFSQLTLNQFISEEIRHENFNVITETRNALKNSSEGERKKALLKHIIAQSPELLIVENVFGNLDTQAQQDIESTLQKLSFNIPIVQITNRKREVLHFINKVYRIKDDSLILIEDFENVMKLESTYFIGKLPESYRSNYSFKSLVKFNKVTVKYLDRLIVNEISWEIKPNEFWQLKGPNGSGKSTLLSLISGDNPKAYLQDLTLFGIKKGSGESVWDIKKKIGYFSSEMLRGFRRRDTIESMIISGFLDSIGLYKIPSETQISIAHEWLRLLGMYDIRKKSFHFLSDGHKRLVLIARAVVKQPPLLILDEPTNGLDDHDASVFTQLINKIAKESETAILYVSHRSEPGLNPDFIYELIPSKNGSRGVIAKKT